MAIADFESLLKEAIGLDAATIGRSALERAVRERERTCRLAGQAYWEHVRSDGDELQALVEAVVVPETWFFRDREAFTALGKVVRDTILRRNPNQEARILSLPCSTGEEPYSMAMGLIDAGVSPKSVRIDAVDVSHRALSHARRGVYGKSAFRGAGIGCRDRYFEETDSGMQIREDVRQLVDFRYGNLAVPATLTTPRPYDIIFCRNVLIYFDRATQDAAVGVLSGLLAPGGFLFVGAAESGVLASRGFVSTRLAEATAFQRRAAEPTRSQHTDPTETPSRPRPIRRAVRPQTVAVPVAQRPTVSERPQNHSAESRVACSDVNTAVELANQGRFSEAAIWCEEYLRRHDPSAQVFHLLGLVRDAAGNHADAAVYYRKALYLDPKHEESLVHLALLMDAQNNRVEAELLRNRARRAAQHDRA